MVPIGLNQKIKLLFVFPDIKGLSHKGCSEVVEQGKGFEIMVMKKCAAIQDNMHV